MDPSPPRRTLLLLGIDIEATGGNLNTNCPYALASVIIDGRTNVPIASFLQLCRPYDDQQWDPQTRKHFLEETSTDWQAVVTKVLQDPHAPTPDQMVSNWYHWLNETLYALDYSPRTHNLLPIVDTTLFDKSMVGCYLPECCRGMDYLVGEFNPWHDLRSFYAGLARVDLASGRYTAKQLFDIILSQNPKLNMATTKDEAFIGEYWQHGVPHDHNPLNDVKCILLEFNKLRMLLNLSL